jgi:hypothetical protein
MVMLGVNFMTGSAFGGAFGSLLKTMTGESSMNTKAPVSATLELKDTQKQ